MRPVAGYLILAAAAVSAVLGCLPSVYQRNYFSPHSHLPRTLRPIRLTIRMRAPKYLDRFH